MSAKVVSVLNMKGGVGKTTVSAHVMREFYRERKKKVLLIDLDPQFNLTQTVLTESQYGPLKASGKTIYAAMEPPSQVGLFDVVTSTHAPPVASTIARRLKYLDNGKGHFDLIPGNFSLVKYSIIADNAKLGAVKNRFRRFVSQAKEDYDLIVVDCNPSSSFITMCALEICSKILVPVRPDKYSVLGLDILYQYVREMDDIHPKPEMNILLNGVPRQGYKPTIENQLRAHNTFGPRVLINKLYQSKILAASPDYTGFATDKGVSHKGKIAAEIIAVANELAGLWGL